MPLDNEQVITDTMVQYQTSCHYLTISIALAIFAEIGCGEIEISINEGSTIASKAQAVCVPVFSAQSMGNDMQGPDMTSAIDYCTNLDKGGYGPGTDIWNACLKMYTAHYDEGTGFSHTFYGTWIRWADEISMGLGPLPAWILLNSPKARDLHYENLEAIWGSEGALCINTPRWVSLYNKTHPFGKRIRDCLIDPHDASIPWSGNPFAGSGKNKGLIVTYVQDRTSEIIIGSDEFGNLVPNFVGPGSTYILKGRVTAWGPSHPVRKTCGGEYVEDTEFIEVVPWKSCQAGTNICQYLMTSLNLSDAITKSVYKIPTMMNFEKLHYIPGKPRIYQFSNAVHVLKSPARGTKELASWLLESAGSRRYVTATADDVSKLCEPVTCIRHFLSLEGYVFPREVTPIP